MSNIFGHIKYVKSLNLSSFNIENATIMDQTYENGKDLKNINISNFNVKNVDIMEFMFKIENHLI